MGAGAPSSASESTTETMVWSTDYEQVLAQSKSSGKPMLIEFTADWCEPCRKLKRQTYLNPRVIAASQRVLNLSVDTASGSDMAKELVKLHQVDVLPTFVVLGTDGKVRPELRRSGFMGPKEFRSYLYRVGRVP